MRYARITRHYCRICGRKLPNSDLRDYAWVCYECNRKQLEKFSLFGLNGDQKRLKEEKRWEEQQRLKEQGYFTIDEVTEKFRVSRRTVCNRIKRYRKLLGVTTGGHRVLVNYRKYRKLNAELKRRSDWVYQKDEMLRRSLKKVSEFLGYTQVVSLEEAADITGLTRRYLRKLISMGRIQAIEKLRLSNNGEPKNFQRDQRPIVFINLPSLVRFMGRLFKPKRSYYFPFLPVEPVISQADINHLARLLLLLSKEAERKVNTLPEEFRLPIAQEYYALQHPDKYLAMKENLLSITGSDKYLPLKAASASQSRRQEPPLLVYRDSRS